MEEKINERTIDRARGVLLSIAGILGVIAPFTKEPQRKAIMVSALGIGALHSLYTVISITIRS